MWVWSRERAWAKELRTWWECQVSIDVGVQVERVPGGYVSQCEIAPLEVPA